MPHKSRAHRAPKARKSVDRARAGFRRAFKRDPQNVGPAVSITPVRLPPLDRGSLPHYWHPDRDGVIHCPADFAAKLAAVHSDLRLTRPPVRSGVRPNCWLLWVKKDSITHPLCPGWLLLMPWKYGRHPLPLDERLFAAIAHFDRRHLGENAVQYFDRIISERDREGQVQRKRYNADLVAEAKEFMQSTKIKNIGKGNKFALHHDGTILPSRGERNWAKELNDPRFLPQRVKRDIERRRDEQNSR